jgi:hypothetical protein
MNSTKKTARIAGLLYLVNGVTGFFGIIYVPSRLIVSGNAAATANNILASERLFRLGIVSELICAAEFVFLLWVLYRLPGAVNKTHASLMVILGLVFVPIMFMNTLSEIAALMLLRGADFLSVFDKRSAGGHGHAVPGFASLRVRCRLDLGPLALPLRSSCL